jgi:D-aminopeptidase
VILISGRGDQREAIKTIVRLLFSQISLSSCRDHSIGNQDITMGEAQPPLNDSLRPRIRDLGYSPGHFQPGPKNSILDVPGVKIGQVTLHNSEKNIHTGVTVVLPRGNDTINCPYYAGTHSLNGMGELTGIHVVKEWGYANCPIALTNTISVGKVYDALFRWYIEKLKESYGSDDLSALRRIGIPIVGETFDGLLNDVSLSAVEREHVDQALRIAESDNQTDVLEGNYGGGTGMMCHGFKGGSGTASRILPGYTSDGKNKDYALGVLVQANHGQKPDLRIGNVPVGKLLINEVSTTHWKSLLSEY